MSQADGLRNGWCDSYAWIPEFGFHETTYDRLKVNCIAFKNDVMLLYFEPILNTSVLKHFTGKQCFFVLRQQHNTVQCLAYVSESISKQMIKFISQ
jgi:hypothetical protein